MDGLRRAGDFDTARCAGVSEPALPDRAEPGEPATSARPERDRWRQYATAFAASLLVLAASLANLLGYHQYPFLRAEVLILLAVFAGIAALYGALYRFGGALGRPLLEGLLVYLAIDLNTEYQLAAVIVASIVPVIGWRTRLSFLPLISAMSGAVILTALLGLGDTRPALARQAGGALPAGKSPAILHVIVDEHGGLPGIADAEARAAVLDLYSRHGFRLFTHAYSRHFRTVNAIPDTLNFGAAGQSRRVGWGFQAGRTEYLSSLQDAGYRLHFYQSEFAEFCRYSSAASCTRYWSPSLHFVDAIPAPAYEKARLIAYKLIVLSGALHVLTNVYDHFAHQPAVRALDLPWINLKLGGYSSTLSGFAALDRLTNDVASAKSGEVYFAHLLVPHYPYVMSRDCAVLRPSQWQFRHAVTPMKARETASSEQLVCLGKQLEELFTAFRRSAAGRDGIIVIHGDHGSRLTRKDPNSANRGRLSARDLMQSYSTLFAVSAPGLPAGLDHRPAATPDILHALHRNRFRSVDGLQRGSGQVYLDGPRWSVGEPVSLNGAWDALELNLPQP